MKDKTVVREVNIFDYAHVLVKWRKRIVINFIAVCVIAALISLFLPKWYTATTTILPPEEQTLGFGLPSMLANLSLGGSAFPGLTTPGAIYVAILESRTVREGVVQDLGLMDVFKSENMEEAVGWLYDRTDIEISDEGVIALRATARTPQRAADIANTYVKRLDRKNSELNVAQARNNRIFIEEQLTENKEKLNTAEEDLRHFQEEYKAISLPEQTAAAIEAAAIVIGEIQALEVQRDVLLSSMRPGNPKVVQIQTKIDALQKQLDRMEFGTARVQGEDVADGSNREFYVPFSEIPTVGIELARLMREFKIQETIFEMLTQQLEQAKIQEAKDTPTVQVIDQAVAPEQRSRPKRKIIVLAAGLLSLFVSIFYAFLVEYFRTMRKEEAEEYRKVEGIFNELRNDARLLKKKLLFRK